jgi:Arc/MetJ-type ribon-helix-helix transcriptional regulator
MSEEEEGDVNIPVSVLDRVDNRIQYTEFESTTEYITYVLEEVLQHVEENNNVAEQDNVDETQVRERLESLGYLDN